MPNHASAAKRDRQNARRNAVNRRNRSIVRTAIKKLRATILSGSKEQVQIQLPLTISAIDKAVTKGVLHRNTGSRYKSRLAGHVNKLIAQQ